MKFKLKLRPKFVVIVSIIIGVVMITSAFFELRESRKEIFTVLREQSLSLIETISLSSKNTLKSSYEIENLISDRLLDNARMIKNLDSLNLLTKTKLIKIGKENNLFRINLFNKRGNLVLSNRVPEEGHIHPEGKINRYEELIPILKGNTKELILGLKNARFAEEQRYAVAIARAKDKGAIVINLDAQEILDFRKKIGIGKIISDIGNNPGIEYIVLQDTLGILAASKRIRSINAIETDPFLMHALNSDSVFFRRFNFDNNEVFEAVKRLNLDNDIIGLYRIGISLDEMRNVEARMYTRIMLITILLAAVSVIVLSIIFTSQNLKTVSQEYTKFKTFAGTVLQKMTDAVIVLDKSFNITFFNDSAEVLFDINRNDVINKNIENAAAGKFNFIVLKIANSENPAFEVPEKKIINEHEKYLNINVTKNINVEGEIENYTIVISDFTERKKLEDQAERNAKLSAMGELASGVAHEIRNPINAIGMIAQRLNKEFSPENDKEEYQDITKVLKDEVSRINKIISQFLNYARPIEIKKVNIDSKEYFHDIYRFFLSQVKEKNIELILENELENEFIADPELLKQSLVNIIQNSVDAVKENGSVTIRISGIDDFYKIEIQDNGTGMSSDKIKKIFDLYYTTKNEGNGLGLSIAQKIITQHRGTIEVDSTLNKGTIFKINLPKT